MFRYLLRRLNLFLATSLVMVGVLFYATGLFPVERTFALTGIHAPSESQLVQIEQDYRLDSNKAMQFIAYLAKAERQFGRIRHLAPERGRRIKLCATRLLRTRRHGGRDSHWFRCAAWRVGLPESA